MTALHAFSSLAAAAALAISTAATAAAPDDDHASHHPPSAPAVQVAQAKPAMPAASMPAGPGMQGINAQMDAMHAMHDRMLRAKTPEERNALMAEQMKLMQGGMAMMNGMGPATMMGGAPGDMAARASGLEQRMDMMQAMMQMMMDRIAAMPPAK